MNSTDSLMGAGSTDFESGIGRSTESPSRVEVITNCLLVFILPFGSTFIIDASHKHDPLIRFSISGISGASVGK